MNGILRAAFALCLVVPVAGCNMVPGTETQEGAAGVRAAIVAGNFGEAVKLGEEVVDANPDDPVAHFELARANALAGRRGKALDALARAVDLGLANADVALRDPAFSDMALMPRFVALVRRASPAASRSREAAALGLGAEDEGYEDSRYASEEIPTLDYPVRSGSAGGDVSIGKTADGGTVIRAGEVVLETDF